MIVELPSEEWSLLYMVSTGKRHRELYGVMKIFYILIWVVITW